MNEFLPYQVDGIDFLSSRNSAMLCDEMGLGKTVQAIGAINKLRARKVLVVCPATLKLNWKRELEKWLDRPLSIQVVSKTNAIVDPAADVVIVNYDLLTYGAQTLLQTIRYNRAPSCRVTSGLILAQLLRREWAVGIFDESHYLKNMDALRTKAVLHRDRLASRCVYKWFLTGTPILNRPSELYPVFRAVFPNVIEPFTSYTAYAKQFCGAYFNGYRLWDRGASNIPELCRRIKRAGIMLRRLKEDVLTELPDKQYQLVPLLDRDNPAAVALINESLSWQIKLKRQDIGTELGEIAELRHRLAKTKLPLCIEHINCLLETKEKIVVFAYHKDVMDKLEEAFKKICVRLDGSTSQKDRQEAVDKFQNDDKTRVFIGQIQAAGVGITLTAANTVVFVESSWVPGEIAQAVDRCHRIGQKDVVLAQFLIIADTIEEHMLATVVDKLKTIKKIHGEEDGTRTGQLQTA